MKQPNATNGHANGHPGINGHAPTFPAPITATAGPLSKDARRAGQALVTGLWMVHDAAHDLRKGLRKLRRAAADADQPADFGLDLAELLEALIGNDAPIQFGQVAGQAAALLPPFDVNRRLRQFHTFQLNVFNKDEPGSPPPKPS